MGEKHQFPFVLCHWMEIFGYPPMDILDFHQMKKRGHLKPKDVDVLRQMLDEMIRGTPFLSQECQIRTKSGAFSWFRIRGLPAGDRWAALKNCWHDRQHR